MRNIKPSFLVVDDFSSMRRLIMAVLRESGFEDVYEADNGENAMAFLRAKKGTIKYVISDWYMPVMDGLALLKAIKADPVLKHTKVMMLTAEGMKSNVLDALQSGASNYMVKPFTPMALEAKLKAFLAPDEAQ